MHNPVVESVYRGATAAGLDAHRFDFSSSDMGLAVAEAIDHLPDGPTPTVVVGYSFGALVASQLDDERIAAWVLIAPPLGRTADPAPIGTDERPKLVLVPAHDQFCPPDAARAATSDWVSTTVEEVAGADHFLAGGLGTVATRTLDFVATAGR